MVHGPLKKGMANHFSILALENPMNSIKRQKHRTLKDGLTRSVGAQYATGEKWKITPDRLKTKQKQYPVVIVTGF